MSSTNNIYYLEQNVITNLNKFNDDYALYLRYANNITSLNISQITQLPKLKQTVINNYNNFNQSVTDLSNGLAIFDPNTLQQYDASYNSIQSSYLNILKMRNNLDFLYNEFKKNSTLSSYGDEIISSHINSSLYTTILWSVVATSIIYIVFTKIK